MKGIKFILSRAARRLKRSLIKTSKLKLVSLAVLLVMLILLVPAALDPYITRNAIIALVAHSRVGDSIVLSTPYSNNHDLYDHWKMKSNSPWLTEQVRFIVPYMSYEKLTFKGNYPDHTIFAPYVDYRSFHIGGTYYAKINFKGEDMVVLNERYLTDKAWNDKVRAFATLTHELIHAQGGVFLNGSSESKESATSAATVEVLAAMCNHSNDVACRSFWREIRNLAWTAVEMRLHEHNLTWLADGLYKWWFLDDTQDWRFEKSRRFWADDPFTLWAIKYKYGLDPWERHVVPGVHGYELETDIRGFNINQTGFMFLANGGPMPFDDTITRLGWLRLLMHGTKGQ